MLAVHLPHRVEEENLQSKDEQELKAPLFARVARRSRGATLAAAGLAVFTGSQSNMDFIKRAGFIGDNLAVAVNKAPLADNDD